MKHTIIAGVMAVIIFVACRPTNEKEKRGALPHAKANVMYSVKHISISINKGADAVYQFAANPENFPQWIAFMKSVQKEGDAWAAKTDLGDIHIHMTAPNSLGVIDHVVTTATGDTVTNLLRVVPNGSGSEVIFTLFRLPGKTDEAFAKDAQSVETDLQTLKKIMESK